MTRGIALLIAVLTLTAVGCKSGSDHRASGDPIFGGNKIPPQGLPMPAKDGYGAGKKDPIFKGATSTGLELSKDESRPGAEITNAALAGAKPTDEIDPLRIDGTNRRGSGGTKIVPVSGTSANADEYADQVKQLGGRMYAPYKLPSGQYEVRVAVPMDGSGAMRSYSAIGNTQALAMRDVMDQIRADKR